MPDRYNATRQRLAQHAAAMARSPACAGFIGSQPAGGAAQARPDRGRTGQLFDRLPAQPRRSALARQRRSSGAASGSSKATSGAWTIARTRVQGRRSSCCTRPRSARVPRSVNDPIATHEVNISGFLNMLVAARDAEVSTLHLRGVQLDVRRPSRLAEGGRPDRPAAVAVCRHQVRQRAVRHGVRAHATASRRSACATSTCSARARIRTAPTPRSSRSGSAALIARRRRRDQRRRRDEPRLLLHRQRRAGEHARGDAGRGGRNQVYNVAVGDRTTLNQLYDGLRTALADNGVSCDKRPVYGPFRAGDVRHSQANVDKARAAARLRQEGAACRRPGASDALVHPVRLPTMNLRGPRLRCDDESSSGVC